MGGFLAGKYSRDKPPPKGSRAEYNSQYLERINNENKYPALEKIVEISNEVGIPIHKLAIAWILRNSEVTAPIVGASRLKQVEENCEIIEIKLTDEIYDKLNDVTKSL
jgi:aryl-alcohol dehydrogenase-like predicted oxidoreductase